MPGQRYKVGFTDKALGDIEGLFGLDRVRIVKGCLRLQEDPAPDGKHVKKLRGYRDLYRLRIGDYRAVFEWKSETVTVITILTRQDFGKKY
ncbi:MAG: type II toxin-antitoxin system RelE/ParE family toxin [Nitrospiraceae bacterium]|nr:type II toxin-antitoxin system RelE/ParE family toxin [Nitrospiraceae bacterium]